MPFISLMISFSSSTVLLPAGGVRFFRKGRPAASMSMAMAKGSAAFTRSIFCRMVSRFQVDIPGLDGGHAAAVVLFQCPGRRLDHGGVGAVAGKGGDARAGTGGHQNVIIGQVVVLVAVVQLHGAHRRGKHGQGHLLAEEIIAGVHGHVLTDGVHVHAQLLPLLIVADEAGADSLGAGAGHGVLAGHAVAHGTGLAVGSHTGPRVG